MKKIFILLAIFILLLSGAGFADTIWRTKEGYSPYSTQKAFKVGDIIYVLVLESTSALQKANTSTNVKDEMSFSFSHTLEQLGFLAPNTQIGAKAQNKFQGDGGTSRMSNIQAKVAARVVDILPNGVLKIVGRHNIEVNDDEQEIIISGLIRAKDVSMENAVFSYQIASAQVSVKGKGAAGDAASPGWITRIFNWIF